MYDAWEDIAEPMSIQLSQDYLAQKFATPERGKFGTVSKIVEIINLTLQRSFSILCNIVHCVYDLIAF